MHRQLKINNMSKFDKLVELAKENIENYIIEDVVTSGVVFLPTNGENLIMHLSGDWYFQMLFQAGYSHKTIYRKIDNMDFNKLASAIDDWYRKELYPKLYNKFQSEGKEILDC